MSQKPKTFFKPEGWLFLFLALISLFYFHGMHKKNVVYKELLSRKQALQNERECVYLEREELQLLIKSYADPAWLEMVLMKGLGMVPKGQIKVYFKQEE